MISFDAVDFSERRSEEVISFFWHSVYLKTIYQLNAILKWINLTLVFCLMMKHFQNIFLIF